MNLTETHILVQALSATNSPVSITDNLKPDNPIIYCNTAFLKLTGYDKEDVIGKNCRFLQGPKTDRSIVAEIRKSLEGKVEFQNVILNYRKDGSTFWNDLNISPVYNEAGVVTHFIGLQFDVTERIEQERAKAEAERLKNEKRLLSLEKDRLLKLNEAKDDFIAIASHQLRTPATIVKQYIGMLHEGLMGELSESQSQAIKMAYESNERQISIIDDLLRIARMDAGKIVLQKSNTNIGNLLEVVIGEFKYRLLDKNLRIRASLPKKDVLVDIDPGLMQTVFENLIDNSIKYTQVDGNIEIRLEEEDNQISIYFIDNGIGIAKKDQEKLFSKFTRANSEEAKNIGGTGLGLYWVKSVLDMHDANIDVVSKYRNGTTFKILFPKNIVVKK